MIDVDHQISTVRRQLGTRVLEAGEARTLTISQTYATTVDDLWDACTDPERIARWFLPVEGDLRVGGRYQLEGNAGGTVLTCDPPTGFTATWEYGGEVSWVEVRIDPDGDDRARLTLAHVAHVADEWWERFGPGATGIGWDLALVGLATHLATGGSATRAEGEAWSVSDEGRRFLAGSSEAWCRAQVEAGDPEADARAAADRTVAFYTGDGAEAPER